MAKYEGYDFCGWATRNDLRCSDGRTIRRDAFAHQDGAKVPLVWGHNHDSPEAVLGHGFLENRPEGVFFYGYFNDSDLAQAAKRDVVHGDVTSLSIWANQLKQKAGDVLHGSIKEVSLVLAGANVGAQITYPVVVHGEDAETLMDEAYIYVGEDYGLELSHADKEEEKEGETDMDEELTVQDVLDTMDENQLKVVSYLVAQAAAGEPEEEETGEEEIAHAEPEEVEASPEAEEESVEDEEPDEERTVQDVLDEMNEEQLKVVTYLVGKAAADGLEDEEEDEEDEEDVGDEDDIEHSEGGATMNFNAFDGAPAVQGAYLSHSDEMNIIEVAKKYGSLREAMTAYAEENNLQHDDVAASPAAVSGATSYATTSGSSVTPAGVDSLFPEWHDVRPGAPDIVTNDQAWVKAVLNKVHKSPFSRIRTSQADLRAIETIRAKGYQKGAEKALAGNYAVAKRTTAPQTVYVKSALNRDDVVDITDFDYVDYQYKIDRMQLEKELARGILIGDGRTDESADKINPENIRPIWGDNSIFTITKTLDVSGTPNGTNTAANFGAAYLYAQALEEALLDAKIDYRGSGAMDMFCAQAFYNKIFLAKDLNGRRIYNNQGELKAALDVDNVYNVPEFANLTRTEGEGSSATTYKLLAIFVNLRDYALGATKGGEITHFTDFDIDFNQLKSLLETRVSGANTRVMSAIVIEEEVVSA